MDLTIWPQGLLQDYGHRKPLELSPLKPAKYIKHLKNHDRDPDIGLRIKVTMPYLDGGQTKKYIGAYCGHGQSKTAFILNGASGDPYNGKILKVTSAFDKEPRIFTEMTKRSPGTTSEILDNSYGVVKGGERYHCWITKRTIPLDQLLEDGRDVWPERCILAALLCCAQCVLNGLRMSDCQLFNVGVLVDREEQHRVVAIDAGSYEPVDPKRYSKRDCNKQVAHKIWRYAQQYDVCCDDVKTLWYSKNSFSEMIGVLYDEWKRHPYLTTEKKSTAQIERELKGEVFREKTEALGSDAYQILALVGSLVVPDWWNEPLAMECYEAAERTRGELERSEWNICTELLSRLKTKGPRDNPEDRIDDELKEVLQCWRMIKEFRDGKFRPGQHIDESLAWQALYEFQEYTWGMELTEEQSRPQKRRRKILNNILHQSAFCKLAAVAIMQVDIPRPQTQGEDDGSWSIRDLQEEEA